MARATLNLRQLQAAVRASEEQAEERVVDELTVRRQRDSDVAEKGILIVGVGRLLTQLAGCCKPAPPDPIVGFVTRGRGVSVHRADCSNFVHLRATHPERVIETTWGGSSDGVFAVDIVIDAHDRQGLLRDVSDVLARERINVIAVNTQSRQGNAHMSFTAEVASVPQLERTLALLHAVQGVVGARRA
ncbi:MAG: bifunctional (p)ppGpp synthetase/guanosine-3',5'-bis(diphosphate) 3'-pyrophosphohydrolase [Candidatus Accumulibacter similis]|nr:MAG: bifunctional (p)ppGpp synthetase/guanosine-3',5'-bis(diphosphate) 3'-pyrophosphohydrolase [Candidatus Accumulibacter similis]